MSNDETVDALEGQPVERAAEDVAVFPVKATLTAIPGGVPDLDAPVRELRAALPADQPLRLRVLVQLYDPARERLYFQWPKVTFGIEVAGTDEAVALREHLQAALEQFVEARK